MIHYGKNCRCRTGNHCREPLHGKDFFAVRSKKNARQSQAGRQRFSTAHGNKQPHGIFSSDARQSLSSTHGKEMYHGKDPGRRTAKNWCTAKVLHVAVVPPLSCGQTRCTAKAPLPCDSSLPCATIHFICFSFYFISSNTHNYFFN